MKNFPFVLLVLFFIGISCKKDSTAPEQSEKYMDLAPGNTWTYETQNNITSTTSTNIVTSTTRDSVIIGKIYHVFTNSNGGANDYYNITGNDYYTFRNLGLTTGNLTVVSLYLKDNAAVGTSWGQTENIPVSGFQSPVPVTFTNSILEKGVNRVVNGKTYNNVIHTSTTISISGLPPGSITTDIQAYYAPKVGLIESKNKINFPLLTINIDQNTILK